MRYNSYKPAMEQLGTHQPSTEPATDVLHYRNALYQGFHSAYDEREGPGMLYLPHSHHLIACRHFEEGKVSGPALFYHSHSKLHYGSWMKGELRGVGVFRIGEIVVIGEYDGEGLGSELVVVFEKYSKGLVLERNRNGWALRTERDVESIQDINTLVKECGFGARYEYVPLVKYLSKYLAQEGLKSMKIRMLRGCLYRFGFTQGLAVIFDDQLHRRSVGMHRFDKLSSMGARYYANQQMQKYVEQGLFHCDKTYVYEQNHKPKHKLDPLYGRYAISGINFVNHFIKDPSEPYFTEIQKILNSSLIKEVFALMLQDHDYNQASLHLAMRDSRPLAEINRDYEIGGGTSPQFKSFNSTKRAGSRVHRDLDVVKMNSRRNNLTSSRNFEQLTQENRLEVIQKEIYGSLAGKTYPDMTQTQFQQLTQSKTKRTSRQPVHLRTYEVAESHQHEPEHLKTSNMVQGSGEILPNLMRNIDIVIREATPDQATALDRTSRSRSKKKIFEPSNNRNSFRRQPSPQTQVSPFKSRKSRIFNQSSQSPQQVSPSRSKSRRSRKIFPQANNQIEASVQRMKSSLSRVQAEPQAFTYNQEQYIPSKPAFTQAQSSFQGMKLSKQSSRSYIHNLPVTFSSKEVRQESADPAEVQEEPEAVEPLRRLELLRQGKTSVKDLLRTKQEPVKFQKTNRVYKDNDRNTRQIQPQYEPIKVEQHGNSPYLRNANYKRINRSKSAKRVEVKQQDKILRTSQSKKTIRESSPVPSQKMSSYLKASHHKSGKVGTKRTAVGRYSPGTNGTTSEQSS